MDDRPLPFALREVRREFARPVLWAVLAGVGVVLAFGGAFGTGGVMRPLPLALYWVVVAIAGYALGTFVSAACRVGLAGWPWALRVAATGAAIGILAAAGLVGLNRALFGPLYDGWGDVAGFSAVVVAVAMVVTVILDLGFAAASGQAEPGSGSGPTTGPEAGPALMARLPLEARGPLVALCAEDHYVRVRTAAGEALVLMRLGDAVTEAAPTPGLRTHRSHWVAEAAVGAARRRGDGAVVVLHDGTEIPVSRANLPALRERGWL
ncbi:MAG: LytTR family DNA-binding domain-containing protein [Shimia sp.]